MKRLLPFALLLAAATAVPAVDVHFAFSNSVSQAQTVRKLYIYPLGPTVAGPSLITRDRIAVATDAAGGVNVSNIIVGAYRAEFIGTFGTTTNWFDFPDTNGYVLASTYRQPAAADTVALTNYAHTTQLLSASNALYVAIAPLLAGTNVVIYAENGSNVVNAEVGAADLAAYITPGQLATSNYLAMGESTNVFEIVNDDLGTIPLWVGTNNVVNAGEANIGTLTVSELLGTISGAAITDGTITSNKLGFAIGGGDVTQEELQSVTNNPVGTFVGSNATFFGSVSFGTLSAGTLNVTNVPANFIVNTNVTDGTLTTNKVDSTFHAWVHSMAGGQATNIYDINWSGSTSNAQDWTAVLTNVVTTNNTFSAHVDARGKGATNAAFIELKAMLWKGPGHWWAYSSNVTLATSDLGARAITNDAGDVVWEVRGGTNEGVNWSLKGWYEHATNAPASVASEPDGNTLTNDLIAFWPMDVGNNWFDLIGSYPLTENGSVTTVSGMISNAVDFVGSTANYLSLADDAVFSVTPNGPSMTVMGWFRPERTNAINFIIAKDTGAGGGREWAVTTSSSGWFLVNYYTNAATSSATLTPDQTMLNVWYMFCAQWDTTNQVHRIRTGTSTNINAWATFGGTWSSTTNTTTAITLGVVGSSTCDGQADNIGIWKRLLTDAEIDTFRTNTVNGISYPW